MGATSREDEYRQIEAELRQVNEHLAAERAAAEAARRALAHMLDRVTDAFMALDTEYRFAYVNRQAAEILGRRPEHLLGKKLFEEFPELVGHPFQHAYLRAAAEQSPVYVEEYYPPFERWFELRVYPSADGLSVFFRDITKRRQAEDLIRERDTQLRLFLEQLPALLWTTDRELRFTSSLGAGLRLVGLKANELVGTSLVEYFSARPEGVAQHRRALGGESVRYDSEWLGRHFDTVTEPLLEAGGQIIGTIGIALDVTERRRNDEALRESEARARLLIQQFPGLMWTTDRDLRFTSTQGAALGGFGHEPNEWVGMTFDECFGPSFVGTMYHRRAVAGESVRYQVEWSGHHFDVVAEPLRDRDNRIIGVTGVALDVTDRQRVEDALRTLSRRLIAAQEEERRRVARELHDEVGQVLTAVKIQIEALVHVDPGGPLAPRLAEAAQSIDNAIGGVRGLSLELRPSILDDLGLVAALRWHVGRVIRETGIIVELAAEPLPTRLPPEMEIACFRVVQEALTNVARHAKATRVVVELSQRENALELQISDDGAGFDPAVARGRAAEGGCMGLSGMEERVRLAGGEFEIKSHPEKGTKVRARFPALVGSSQ